MIYVTGLIDQNRDLDTKLNALDAKGYTIISVYQDVNQSWACHIVYKTN